MDDNQEIVDEFNGVKVWWTANHTTSKSQSFSYYPVSEEKRFLTLTFHKRHRDLITTSYIQHVLEQGKAITLKNRQLKIYTNNPSNNWWGYKSTKWSHTIFEHPARFETLAMEPTKKEEIIKDLVKFKNGKEYYAKVGKAWKRGYLLFGPPGTGKSTMISAIANFMNYDVYDLELTTVKDNNDLKRLLIETSSKSIIVIEDIDCSLDLTGQRKKKKEKDNDENKDKSDPIKEAEKEDKKESKVTLSDSETCLKNLIQSLEIAKKAAKDEEAKKKAEDEEAQLKVEKDNQELTQEEVKVKANDILEEKVKENGVIH
ncbi:AAA-ATPase ASD, mitochondrial [Trifolium repens]|nr:AAA-ATPase ASD, mitochondrial [Trifolium repens]